MTDPLYPPRPGPQAVKPPAKAGAKAPSAHTYSPPTPKVSRQTKGKVLSPAERAAFLASRSDLAPKG